MPDLLDLGGEEAFAAYQEAFDRIVRGKPIFDPRGNVIVFNDDSCRHVCYREERGDKARKRATGEERTREEWDQARAAHIPWIVTTLTQPVQILQNHRVEGNEAYLLGFPRNDVIHPNIRYYVSVGLLKGRRRLFKTAYPIDLEYWKKAHRSPTGRSLVIWQARTGRY